ncbi:hypothetical protein ACIBTV_26535 [Micromonospora sp. NPDC049366]|uniref:hypothetical protein n=1 Tax=Micromonospora sp. NPDC049366 TaxID=3364271 RepID=UPI0037A09AB0
MPENFGKEKGQFVVAERNGARHHADDHFADRPAGVVTDEEVEHYRRRDDVGRLSITGAIAASPNGRPGTDRLPVLDEEPEGRVLLRRRPGSCVP